MLKIIKKYFNIKKIALVSLGSLLLSCSLTYFIMPVGLYTGGLMGLILIITTLTKGIIPFGVLYFLLNLPLLMLSWFKLGKRFTFYTIIAVVLVSFFVEVLPDMKQISDDILIMALFGGILSGVAIVLVLRAGGSGGGSDVVSLYFAERTGKPIGHFALIINVIVLAITAALFEIEIVLYTLIGSYVTSVVIDKFHTRYQKLTLTINTANSKELIAEIQAKTIRGVTIIPAIGGYTKQQRDLLYIVVSSFELTPMLDLVRKVDENAFINITKSTMVFGNFKQPSIDET